jgi:hypothetical protein
MSCVEHVHKSSLYGKTLPPAVMEEDVGRKRFLALLQSRGLCRIKFVYLEVSQ